MQPGLLEVEITESSIMADAAEATRTLEYLETLGVRSAIDDFGTGYSSLALPQALPAARAQDRRLVRARYHHRPRRRGYDHAAVISMAHSLGLKVIAEGVETEAQLAFLMREQCDEVQGFLFSPAVPGHECALLVADAQRFASVIEAVQK